MSNEVTSNTQPAYDRVQVFGSCRATDVWVNSEGDLLIQQEADAALGEEEDKVIHVPAAYVPRFLEMINVVLGRTA
jgi:hypothetical protein